MSHAEQGKVFSQVMLGAACALVATAIGFWGAGAEWGSVRVIVALSLAAGTLTFALVGFLQTRFAEEKEKREIEAKAAVAKEAEAEKEKAAKAKADEDIFSYYK